MFQFFWLIHQLGMGAGEAPEIVVPPVTLAIVGYAGAQDVVGRSATGDVISRSASSDVVGRGGGGPA